MKKGLLITSDFPPSKGGIQSYLSSICEFLGPGRVLVVAPKDDLDYRFDKSVNFEVIRVRFPSGNVRNLKRIFFFLHLLAICLKKKFDFIYCGHTTSVGVFSLALARFFNKPLITFTYALEILKNKDKKLLKKVLDWSDYIVTLGNFMKRELKNMGYPEDKIIVISPTVDTKRFSPKKPDPKLIKNYGLENKKVILTVGRIVPRKGHEQILKAMAEIIGEVPNTVYLIVGEGPELENIKQLTKDLQLSNHVVFLGRIAHDLLPDLYNLCSVFVTANRNIEGDVEGFGIVFIEASACEKPVVGGKFGGSVDAIDDGRSGFLVDSEDPSSIAKACLKLLTDPSLSKKMGKYGREWVKNEFNHNRQTKKLMDLKI